MQSTTDPAKRPRRQWGSDRRDQPLPTVPPPVSDRRIRMGRLAIVLTVSAWIAYVVPHDRPAVRRGPRRQRPAGDRGDRLHGRGHRPDRVGDGLPDHPHRLLLPQPRAPPGAAGGDRRLLRAVLPTVTVLVPSYQEDERVIRTTLLSAALQEHPHLRVVLLIDDPPSPPTADGRDSCSSRPGPCPPDRGAARRARAPAFQAALDALRADRRWATAQPTVRGHARRSPSTTTYAAGGCASLAARQEIVDHTDAFFVDHVLGALGRRPRVIAARPRRRGRRGRHPPAAPDAPAVPPAGRARSAPS